MADLPIVGAGRPGARELAGLHAAILHHRPGDADAAAALAECGLPALPAPLGSAGEAPLLAWRSPQEALLVSERREPVDALTRVLAPGRRPGAVAIDLSEALVAYELQGPELDEWLAHLVDAASIPRRPGGATRARMADVAVVLLRRAPDRLWLLGDRTIAAYLRSWLAFAHAGAFSNP